jgi:hypothetical protein
VLRKQTHVVGGVKQPAAYFFYEESELVFDTIDDAKVLVTYMKKTLLNKKLNNKMKQDVATRFDGLLIMFAVCGRRTGYIHRVAEKEETGGVRRVHHRATTH